MEYDGLFCQGVGSLRRIYLSMCSSALRRGALEALIIPSRGVFISRMRKIAPDRDRAQTNITEITVRLRGATGHR